MEYLTSHYITFRKTHYRKIKLFEFIAKKVELLEYSWVYNFSPWYIKNCMWTITCLVVGLAMSPLALDQTTHIFFRVTYFKEIGTP